MWEWNSATRHHLCPEDWEWFYCRTSQRVRSSRQACRGAGVWDGRLSATVVHNRVERGERRGAKGGGTEDKMFEREMMWQNKQNWSGQLWFITIFIYTRSAFCSQCSRSCGKGLQMREVRCLTQDKKHSHDCDLSPKPEQEQICNTIPCSPQVSGRCVCVCDHVTVCLCVCLGLSSPPTSLSSSLFTDENCRDRRHNCVMVVQARLCVYSYYKANCCASCTQSAQRAKRHWPANRRQPRCASQGLGQKGAWNDKCVEMDSPE